MGLWVRLTRQVRVHRLEQRLRHHRVFVVCEFVARQFFFGHSFLDGCGDLNDQPLDLGRGRLGEIDDVHPTVWVLCEDASADARQTSARQLGRDALGQPGPA